MSTLPRTKSLSGADTSSLSRNFRDRNRPSSLCEASWNKVYPSGQDRLMRTPSQANNLCTTVPTSIVNRTLGGRHTPTRSSLRHSRMAVMARNGKGGASQRKIERGGSFGRVASLIILAYILVGVVGGLLAVWLVKWVPSLHFKEVPHYASGSAEAGKSAGTAGLSETGTVPVKPENMIVLSGILALVLFHCIPPKRKIATRAMKVVLLLSLTASVLSCIFVCGLDILHLKNLAPMDCQVKSDVIIQSPSRNLLKMRTFHPSVSRSLDTLSETSTKLERIKKYSDDDEEGSGTSLLDGKTVVNDDEEGFAPTEGELPDIRTTPLSFEEAQINDDIYVNVSVCVCSRMKKGWKIKRSYPNLTCDEVKNVLPIFLVASCVVTGVGTILSAVFLYLVWIFRRRLHGPYGTSKQHEVQPFIFKSNFKLSQTNSLNKKSSVNGNHPYR